MKPEQYQARIAAQQEIIRVLGAELASRFMALRVQRAAIEKLRKELAGSGVEPRFTDKPIGETTP